MGLNIVVFRNAFDMIKEFGDKSFEADPETGEVISIDGVEITIEDHILRAYEARLGNTSEIGFIDNLVKHALDRSDSFISRKILYSGSHSGDIISSDDLQNLSEEISFLKGKNIDNLKHFIDQMDLAISSSQEQRNPIVFI